MKSLDTLNREREQISTEQRRLLDTAIESSRDMNSIEQAKYDELEEKFHAVSKEINETKRSIARSQSGPIDPGPWRPGPPSRRSVPDDWEGKSMRFIPPGHYGRLSPPVMDITESRDLNRLFAVGYSGLRDEEKNRWEQRRTMQADLDTSGGFLIAPESFTSKIVFELNDLVWMRGICTQIELKYAQSLSVPVEAAGPDDADWTSELSVGGKTDIDFTKRVITPSPCAKEIILSNTLVERAAGSLSYATSRLAYKFGITEEKAFLTGHGGGQPLGVFTLSDYGIDSSRDISTANSTTEIKPDNLHECMMFLKAQYRKNAVWILGREALKQIRKMKSGDGQFLFQPGLTADKPDTILGKKYFESEYCPATFTSGNYVLALGDFQFYWVVTALNMKVTVLRELYAEQNSIALIGRLEVDASPIVAEAFVRSKLA
jgi:HK97 family phage major capsid protein